MIREEILNRSKTLVHKIYEKMSIIETCDSVAEKIKELEICFNDADNKEIISLEGVLKVEQLAGIREGIIGKIYENIKEAESFLDGLSRKPATVNPVFEAAIQEMVNPAEDPVEEKLTEILQEEAKRIEDKPLPTLDEKEVDNVRRMYHDEAKTMKEIAAYYGVTKSQMNTYISKYSLRRTSYKNDGFTDSEVGSKRKIVVPEPLRSQSSAIKCRVCGKAIKFTGRVNSDTWPYRYKRGSEDIYCCGREHYLMGKAKDA